MRRAASALTALLLLGGCSAQSSADSVPRFTRFHLDVEATRHGEVHTEADLGYDFLEEESSGIYLLINTYREIEGDRTRDRYTPVTSWSARDWASNQPVRAEAGQKGTTLYIGDEERPVTGLHQYGVTYTIDGLVDSGTGEGGADEIHWNIIGHEFDDPVEDIEITFTAPTPSLVAGCWAGRAGSTDPCEDLRVEGSRLHIAHDRLDPGEGITIALAFEPGTFSPQVPYYAPISQRPPSSWLFLPAALALGGFGSIAAISIIGLLFRDERYRNEIPGLEPVDPDAARVGRAGLLPPRPAVAFTPPAGMTPSRMAALLDPSRLRNVIPAAIMSLAVHGFLRLTTVSRGIRLTRVSGRRMSGLSEPEKYILSGLFPHGNTVTITRPRSRGTPKLRRIRELALGELTENGWIRKEATWPHIGLLLLSLVASVTLLSLAVPMVFSAEWDNLALVAGPLGFTAMALFRLRGLNRRTAAGHAAYVQALAFKEYLKNAEAHQLQFEADADIFSRYLPYAVALGVVKKWVGAFEGRPECDSYTYPWFNGGTVSFLGSVAARGALFSGLDGANAIGGYSSGVTAGGGGGLGGGSVGSGLGGGGGGRW